jgi:hypothetical protein
MHDIATHAGYREWTLSRWVLAREGGNRSAHTSLVRMLAKCIREALLLPCVLCGTNQKIATEPPCHQAHAVCRHDLATACRKAADPATTGVPAFDIFHTVGQVGLPSLLALDLTSYLSNYLTLLWITIYLTSQRSGWAGQSAEAEKACNVSRAAAVLGMRFRPVLNKDMMRARV